MVTIEKIISDVLKIPQGRISDVMAMKDTVEWDSLKHMELILAIEQAYAIELTGDEIADMTTVAAIRTILNHHGLSWT